MKTLYYTATSVDGFIADRRNSLEWLLQFHDDSSPTGYEEFIRDVGAIAMGSTTYEWVLEHEIRPGTPEAKPWPYTQPSWIFTTRSLPPVPGADLRFVRGDVRPVHREMVEVAGGKNVWVVGGGDLVGQFHDCGLLDELVLFVAPVMLGGGAPLLPREIATPPLRLLGARTHGDTFVELRYEVQRPA